MNDHIDEHYIAIIGALTKKRHTTLNELSALSRGRIKPQQLITVWSELFVGNDMPCGASVSHEFLLRPDVVLRYYSYKQYKHSIDTAVSAKKESLRSQKFAQISIWLAIGALLVSVVGLTYQFFIQ